MNIKKGEILELKGLVSAFYIAIKDCHTKDMDNLQSFLNENFIFLRKPTPPNLVFHCADDKICILKELDDNDDELIYDPMELM